MRPLADRLWARFFHASAFFALFPGFATGGALFAALSLGIPTGSQWELDAQAHGHAEVFGWAGMLVIGVGYHFLPRLRGTALALPGLASGSFWVLLFGLVARILLEAIAALRVSPALLPSASAVELAGVTLALIVLGRTFAGGPPVSTRAGYVAVRPFVLVSFASLWLSLALDFLGLVATVAAPSTALPGWSRAASLDVAFAGFLVPIGIAMSARTFPLYFRARLPNQRVLRVGLGLAVGGLVLRLLGRLVGMPAVVGVGEVAGGIALVALVLGLGIFAARRPAARADVVRHSADPTEVLSVAAYVWLVVGALILAVSGLGDLRILAVRVSGDALRHALGAGYVALLIFGVGGRLLPGFANRPLRAERLVWATLAFGLLAALLRVAPGLVGVGDAGALLAGAGLFGMLGVAAFWWNVPATARGR